jgi:hypothetical protein
VRASQAGRAEWNRHQHEKGVQRHLRQPQRQRQRARRRREGGQRLDGGDDQGRRRRIQPARADEAVDEAAHLRTIVLGRGERLRQLRRMLVQRVGQRQQPAALEMLKMQGAFLRAGELGHLDRVDESPDDA